jgi:hypothetical protein
MQNLDEWMAFISTHLPEPVTQEQAIDGLISFTAGEPGQVVVHLTQSTIVVLEYAVRRETPLTSRLAPRRIGAVRWRRAPNPEMIKAVAALIAAARASRLEKFRVCDSCEVSKPPEWMLDERLCLSCAEHPLGVPGDG